VSGLKPPNPLGWINHPPIIKVRLQSQLLNAVEAIKAAVLDVKADFKENYRSNGGRKDADYKFAISDRKEIIGLMRHTGAEDLKSGGGDRQAYIYQVTGIPAAAAVVEPKKEHVYVWTLLSHPYFSGAAVVMIEFLLNPQVKHGRGARIQLLPLNDRTRALYSAIGFKDAPEWEMYLDPTEHPDRWELVGGQWKDKRAGTAGYLDSIDFGPLKSAKSG
jgi:hypothetical protein